MSYFFYDRFQIITISPSLLQSFHFIMTKKNPSERTPSRLTKRKNVTVTWQKADECKVMDGYIEIGPIWTKICMNLNHISANCAKNKVNCLLRKFLNKMNYFLADMKKSITRNSLKKFLLYSSPVVSIQVTPEERQSYEYARNEIIKSFLKDPESLTQEKAIQGFEIIKQFNTTFRYLNPKPSTSKKEKKVIVSKKEKERTRKKKQKKQVVKVETKIEEQYPPNIYPLQASIKQEVLHHRDQENLPVTLPPYQGTLLHFSGFNISANYGGMREGVLENKLQLKQDGGRNEVVLKEEDEVGPIIY